MPVLFRDGRTRGTTLLPAVQAGTCIRDGNRDGVPDLLPGFTVGDRRAYRDTLRRCPFDPRLRGDFRPAFAPPGSHRSRLAPRAATGLLFPVIADLRAF